MFYIFSWLFYDIPIVVLFYSFVELFSHSSIDVLNDRILILSGWNFRIPVLLSYLLCCRKF